MASPRMHAEEIDTDVDLVRRLLLKQHPQWAELPIERVASYGTDHAIYRLGDEMSVRLPRIGWATAQMEKERRWLPALARHLPLAIPRVLATGEPALGYPYAWSVQTWLPGGPATAGRVRDKVELARDLGAFIQALRAIDATGAPVPSLEGGERGARLMAGNKRDRDMRAAIDALEPDDGFDPAEVLAAWEQTLRAQAWDGPPLWLHGDLSEGNLLVRDGRLRGVIDWGCLAAGDPAAELGVAWDMFDGASRAVFREVAGMDDATWARGRAFGLAGVVGLVYYRRTNPPMVMRSRRMLAAVLADFAGRPSPLAPLPERERGALEGADVEEL